MKWTILKIFISSRGEGRQIRYILSPLIPRVDLFLNEEEEKEKLKRLQENFVKGDELWKRSHARSSSPFFNLTILDYRCRGWSQGGSSSSSWNSRAQSGRDSATKDKERGREREKETLGNRDEARVFSLLSRAELITRRTANRAKRQSGYILSRIRDAFAYAHQQAGKILERAAGWTSCYGNNNTSCTRREQCFLLRRSIKSAFRYWKNTNSTI